MGRKSTTKNLSYNSKTQFHQLENLHGQQTNLTLPNQRVLILSTPIKLNDGTVNMEQRTIPLRIDNSQLMVTAQDNKSRLVSLKRNNNRPSPPSALALPINKLNRKTPTVVKNEVGQVMGKLIPLGKFSNITPSPTLSPISTVSTSPVVSIAATKNLKPQVFKQNSKWGGYKLVKLDKDVIEASKKASEKFNEVMKSNQQASSKTVSENNVKTVVTVSKSIMKQVKNNDEQLITVTDIKPKKQVHLVLKGFENMASIGQTGTNIKLIPLEHWKGDKKLNFVKNSQTNTSTISQPKIVDVRSCAMDKMEDNDIKFTCDYIKEDFDIEVMLEKDPLDIDGISSEEAASFAQSLERSTLDNSTNSNVGLDLVERFQTSDETNSTCVTREFGNSNSSAITSLTHNDETGGLKLIRESETDSDCKEKINITVKDEIPDTKCGETVIRNVEEVDCVVDHLVDCENDQEGDKQTESNNVNFANLYKRFQISKDDMTLRETEMLSYICNLKKKLLQNPTTRVRRLAALEKSEYLGFNNLSSIQKRFIKSQLRNSGRGPKNQSFTRTDMAMAKDVLRATSPKGYNNLRKLFSLPSMSAVFRAMSKT